VPMAWERTRSCRTVLPTLLAEAWEPLQRRDFPALRSLGVVAPVTKRSGKSCIVVRRQACDNRLANALCHWVRVAMQHDPRSRAKCAELRKRGHSHSRALRSVADRNLNVACAMLRTGTLFDPPSQPKKPLEKRWGVSPGYGRSRREIGRMLHGAWR
jgi:Transposase IS116/IS110/IS902 family